MSEEKPDGWVICDAETGRFMGDWYSTEQEALEDFEHSVNYRIRPVKLVFLDKPGAELPSSD